MDAWSTRQQQLHNLASFQRQPKPRRMRRPKFTDRELAIAIAAAEKKEKAA